MSEERQPHPAGTMGYINKGKVRGLKVRVVRYVKTSDEYVGKIISEDFPWPWTYGSEMRWPASYFTLCTEWEGGQP